MTGEFESLGSAGGAVAAALLLLAAVSGVGRWIVPAARPGSRRVLDIWLVRATVGLVLVGWLGVTLGCGKLLSGRASLVLLVVLAGLNVAPLANWWLRASRQAPGDRQPQSTRRLPGWALLAALTTVLVTLGPALCLPTGWDELVYHHE